MKPKITEVNHGIACRIGDKIYVNNKLKKYNPYLYSSIILHEISHTSGFSLNDIAIDLNNKHLKGMKKEYWKFVLTHPSSWTEFFPFWFYGGKFVLNPLLTFFYCMSISIAYFIARGILS